MEAEEGRGVVVVGERGGEAVGGDEGEERRFEVWDGDVMRRGDVGQGQRGVGGGEQADVAREEGGLCLGDEASVEVLRGKKVLVELRREWERKKRPDLGPDFAVRCNYGAELVGPILKVLRVARCEVVVGSSEGVVGAYGGGVGAAGDDGQLYVVGIVSRESRLGDTGEGGVPGRGVSG